MSLPYETTELIKLSDDVQSGIELIVRKFDFDGAVAITIIHPDGSNKGIILSYDDAAKLTEALKQP